MINLDIRCVIREVNKIISNYKKHDTEITLYALGILEIISLAKITNNLSQKIIKYLRFIKNYINCHIDFELLNYIIRNNKKIKLKEDISYDNISSASSSLSSSSNSILSESFDLDEKIAEMLKSDSLYVNKIIDESEYKINDDYGTVDIVTINLSKKLFSLLDRNKDGYISASDAIEIIEMSKKNPLIFEFSFSNTMIQLLISQTNNRINFDIFFEYFI